MQLVLGFVSDPGTFLLAYPAMSVLTHLTGAVLLAGFAAVIGWHAVLRQRLLPGVRRPWLTPPALAAAMTAGILVGEPFALYHGSVGSWGLFDADGATGLARWVAAGALAGMMLVLVVWMRQTAHVFTGVVDWTPRVGVLVTTLVAALVLYPYHVSWSAMHDSLLMTTVFDFDLVTPGLAWTAEWSPPAQALVMRAYLPMVAVAALPGSALLLALPSVAVAVIALLRPPVAPPRWWQAAGLAASGAQPPRPARLRLGRAVWTGVAGATAFLVTATLLALLVRTCDGLAGGDNIVGAGIYLLLANSYLLAGVAAVAALVAGLLVGPAGRFPLALLAATVTAAGGVLLSPAPIFVGVCGTEGSAECLPAVGRSVMVTTMFGASWAIVLGCAAGLLATGLTATVAGIRRWRSTVEEADQAAAEVRPVARRPVRVLYGVVIVMLLLAPPAVGGWLMIRLIAGAAGGVLS
ncbi:hypothetical protein ACN27F_30155 [Solwaraspora sp. WMMB335]|uniref:hypothetical protein n=1 Tax=Solwaraspora sp. WMMB335 TaxID=3404118 RepID=UPI003B94E8DC